MAESTEIAILQGQWRQDPNSRMRALLEAPPIEPEPESNSDNRHQTAFRNDEDDVDLYINYLIYVDLYNSAKQGEGCDFLDALERVSGSNKVCINRLLKSVSLARDTFLHIAASNGNVDIVNLIITHCPSLLNLVNLEGDTAVHVAAKGGEIWVLQVINSKRKEFLNSRSLIFCGLTNTQVEWTDDLLKVKNKQGNTPLHEALINGHENLAFELLKEDVSVSVFQNKEDKSAFYLAAEAGYKECLELMMDYAEREGINLRNVGKSPIHAAILGKHRGALNLMLWKQPGSINLRDDEGRNPLHFAALTDYSVVVHYLIVRNNLNVIKRDKYGQLPIHLASMNGHIKVIEQLLKQHYNPHELLNGKGQNILHVAAKSGKYEVVIYILKHRQEFNQLINKKDDDGNTPLHLATMNSYPKIVSALTWDKRVDLDSSNNDNLTALDVAKNYMDERHTFDQWLTWLSLKASRASLFNAGMPSKPPNTNESSMDTKNNSKDKSSMDTKNNSKDKVNTLLLVSTLIVTVTFQACYTLPGGNNDSEPNKGFATMIKYTMFQVFVICDTIALFTSLVVAAALIFTQVDITITQTVLKLASPLLEFALINMSLAFMSGVIVAVNNLKWLSNAIWITVTLFLSVIVLLLIPISLPFTPRSVLRQSAKRDLCLSNHKIILKVLLLESIIVVHISLETGCTKLAYNNSVDTCLGITSTIRRIKNYLFVFCNMVSMYTSIAVTIILIQAHFGDATRVFSARRFAKPLLGNGMAVTMATLALMPGVYPVGSKHYLLVDALLITGMASLVFFAMIFFPVCLPLPSRHRSLHYITYFPTRMMLLHACDHHVEEWFLQVS